MDFSLTEEHEAVRALALQILADATTTERLGQVPADGFDQRAWTSLAEAGLLGVALPESAGGSGLGFLGAHLILEQIGATAAAVPFWETVVLGALPVATFGTPQQQELLPGVLAGETLLAPALAEDGAADPTAPRTQAVVIDDGWELAGVKTNVPAGAIADVLLVSAATGDGTVGVWLVPARSTGVEIRPQQVISETPFAEIVLDRVTLPAGALLGGTGPEVLDWLLLHGAAGLASLTSGICGAVVRLSADYTSRREQFGRPVATFQAVAQRMADAFIDAEGVALTALQAAWRLSEGLPAGDEVAIAKWWAAEASHRVLHAAHHVHGGVGVDREYPLHRYFGLAKQSEFLLGGATAHLLQLGASMAAEPA